MSKGSGPFAGFGDRIWEYTQMAADAAELHAKRIDTGSAWVLANNPNGKFFDPENPDEGVVPNKRYRLIDLVQASAAAPTFFDEVVIPIAYDEHERVTQRAYFVDGAVSGNNNPSMSLLLLALLPGYGFSWKSGGQNLMMTSFGTGVRRPEIDGESFREVAARTMPNVVVYAAPYPHFDTEKLWAFIVESLAALNR